MAIVQPGLAIEMVGALVLQGLLGLVERHDFQEKLLLIDGLPGLQGTLSVEAADVTRDKTKFFIEGSSHITFWILNTSSNTLRRKLF